MYQYKRRTDRQWQTCDRDMALRVLSHGYFDPERVLAYVDEGQRVETLIYEVRRTVESLEPQRSEPTPEADGEILYG